MYDAICSLYNDRFTLLNVFKALVSAVTRRSIMEVL